MSEIDTRNDFMVSVHGESIVLLNPPSRELTREQALRLAAWLVALADRHGDFPAVLDAVQDT